MKVRTLGLIFKLAIPVVLTFFTCYLAVFLLFLLQISISSICIALVSTSLRRTSAPIQITIVFGVLGTQETFCYLVPGLLERDCLHPTPPTD